MPDGIKINPLHTESLLVSSSYIVRENKSLWIFFKDKTRTKKKIKMNIKFRLSGNFTFIVSRISEQIK